MILGVIWKSLLLILKILAINLFNVLSLGKIKICNSLLLSFLTKSFTVRRSLKTSSQLIISFIGYDLF